MIFLLLCLFFGGLGSCLYCRLASYPEFLRVVLEGLGVCSLEERSQILLLIIADRCLVTEGEWLEFELI